MDETTYWLALSRIPGIGGVTMRHLPARLGSAAAVFAATPADLLATPRVTEATVAALRALDLEEIAAAQARFAAQGIVVLTWRDAAYPGLLRAIASAPPVLFCRGALPLEDDAAVAIVGTRSPSLEATRLARWLGHELASRGVTVVSGLALGIDTAAHRGALQAANGRTVAVLGCGLNRVHPARKRPLAQAIVRRGALLSEQWPETAVEAQALVARNRLISGLARAVIVVEAPAESGSRYAAANALKQGRLLFAVPGSPGADALIAGGAIPLTADADPDALAKRIREHVIAPTAEETAVAQLPLFAWAGDPHPR